MLLRAKGMHLARKMLLGHCQSEQKSKAFWNPKKPDGDPRSSGTTSSACQSLLKTEARMSPLCSGEKRDRAGWISARRQGDLDLQTLIAQELDAGPLIPSSAPVAPEQGSRSDGERMPKYTHLAWLRRLFAEPLTLLPQRAGAAMADTGRVDHEQAPSASRRCSWASSVEKPRERNVPSDGRAKSRPVKRPPFQDEATSAGP
jgi:hypothetical protein